MNTVANTERFSLKDHLFNRDKVQYLADLLQAADTQFSAQAFVQDIMKTLPELPLKERIVLIAETLEAQLSSDFSAATAHIIAALPAPLDPTKTDDDFGDFIFAPFGEYVVRNGLQQSRLETSFATLKEITKRFSMEDAIRYFINEFPAETMATLEQWSTDDNYHVRRLTSEGTRHLLPWSGRIKIPITAPLPILDTLHADSTRYVTRSVANHLNDIAKVEPAVVIKTLKRWHKAKLQNQKELAWITNHALRTLVKDGNPDALALLGYRQQPKIVVSSVTLAPDSKQITKDGTLAFSATILAEQAEKLMVDYVIEFVKANGTHAPKVFKLKKLDLRANESVVVSKKHRFMSTATTYKLHPGVHTVTLQINGKLYDKLSFTIT